MLNGVKLAIDEINSFGGYLGRPIELVIKDDKANPELGLKMSQELIADQVIAAIGFCNTGVAMKSIDVFQTNKTPLIVPCSTGTPVTSKFPPAESYIFRNAPKDAIQAPFIVEEIVSRNWTKVAIFADKSGYGEAGFQDVQQALAKKKLQAIYVARFELGVKDLSEELKEARKAGANVIFSYTVGPENAVIALGRQALGWKVPQIGAWPLSFPFFIEGGQGGCRGRARQALRQRRQGCVDAQHAGRGHREKRCGHLRAPARRQAQHLRAAQAIGIGGARARSCARCGHRPVSLLWFVDGVHKLRRCACCSPTRLQ
jgi:branched-chain amino acid transport system substrate-binding protein